MSVFEMPPKKDKSDDEQERLIRTRQEVMMEELDGKLTEKIDSRFGQMQEAMAAMADKLAQLTEPRAPASGALHRAHTEPLQSTSNAQAGGFSAFHQNMDFMELDSSLGCGDSQGQGRKQTLLSGATSAHHGNNNGGAHDTTSWIIKQAAAKGPGLFPQHLPTSINDIKGDETIDQTVQKILTDTAHQLAKGSRKQDLFPHNYVFRGPELKKPSFNSLSLQEYAWAIIRMTKDQSVPDDIKPELYNHVEELLEDACTYDWQKAVRKWSEQVFNMIAHDRLPLGWKDTSRIQMMRLSISHASTARLSLSNSKDLPKFKQSGNNNTVQDPLKGGPPCKDFNSHNGCSFASGHLKYGKKMIHICSFCLANTSAANPHSEAECRNKIRFSGPQGN